MRPLYKTTVTIWSQFPGDSVELSELAREAEQGLAYCANVTTDLIAEPSDDPAFHACGNFFNEVLP